MKRLKTICLVTPCILPVPATKGGAIETLITMLLEQNETEQKVFFICISVYNKEAEVISSDWKYSKVIYLKNEPILLRRCYNWCIKKTTKYVKKVYPQVRFRNFFERKRDFHIKKHKIDYLVLEGGDYDGYKQLSKWLGRERVYLHIHHELFSDKEIDNIIGHYIAVSKYIQKQFISTSKLNEQDGAVVLNGIDEKKFNKQLDSEARMNLRKGIGILEKDFVVIYCGRIVKEKGVRELIQAFKAIDIKDIKLLIIGSINFAEEGESEYLNNVLEEVGKSADKIKYLGYIDNSDLHAYYQCADIQVIPSIWEEAAGLVAIEGMISGLPLIVTESGGMVEYVDSECALYVKRDKNLIDNLKYSILDLYNHPAKCMKMAEHGRKRAVSFSKKEFYKNYIKIFSEDDLSGY